MKIRGSVWRDGEEETVRENSRECVERWREKEVERVNTIESVEMERR